MFKLNGCVLFLSILFGLFAGLSFDLWYMVWIQLLLTSVFYNISNIIYDSYLPILIKINPDMQHLAEQTHLNSDK